MLHHLHVMCMVHQPLCLHQRRQPDSFCKASLTYSDNTASSQLACLCQLGFWNPCYCGALGGLMLQYSCEETQLFCCACLLVLWLASHSDVETAEALSHSVALACHYRLVGRTGCCCSSTARFFCRCRSAAVVENARVCRWTYIVDRCCHRLHCFELTCMAHTRGRTSNRPD
jgi:hypothetical protein